MLNSVARLVATYGDMLKDDSFKGRLGRYSVREISRTAKERGGGTLGYAEAVLNLYNKKMRNTLPISALYTKRVPTKAAEEIIDNN